MPDVDVRFRRPEYTGENRCTPCTVVNVAVLAAVSAAVAAVSIPGSAVAFGAGALSIYARGYLVPGTPALTRRYFPDWVLAKFDKLDVPDSDSATGGDPAAVLEAAGAVEPCDATSDLCLTDSFEGAWRDRTEAVRGTDPDALTVTESLNVAPSAVDVTERGDAVRAEVSEGESLEWPSRRALAADLAAAALLEDRDPGWHRRTLPEQARVLRGLRVFLDTCPSCGGSVTPSADTVESCCREVEVVAVACDDCGARFLETRVGDA